MIPKIIHQIWIGNKFPPAEYLEFSKKWKELYPDFKYVLWTNNDVKNVLSKKNEKLYNDIPVFAGKADLLRYEIIHKFGGIYIDMDNEPLKRMDFLDDTDFFIGKEKRGILGTGLFGSIEQTLFLNYVLNNIEEYINNTIDNYNNDWYKYCYIFTGPMYITKMIQPYLSNPNYNILDTKYFYPYNWDELSRRHENFKETCPDSYSVHHWSFSWTCPIQ